MTLAEWLASQGKGAKHRLHIATGLSLPTIDRALEARCHKETAEIIHRKTGRKVPVASMTRAPKAATAAGAKGRAA